MENLYGNLVSSLPKATQLQAAQPQASQSPWYKEFYDPADFHLLQNPYLSFWEGWEVERIGKGGTKEGDRTQL